MQKLLILLAAFLLTGLAALYGGYAWLQAQLNAPLNLQSAERYTIMPGQSLTGVAYELTQLGILPNPLVYKVATRLLDLPSDIKAGEYELTPGLTPRTALDLFLVGSNVQYFITFAEGLTSYDIVQTLRTQEDFVGALTDIPPEGSLLPETYSYQKGDTRTALIARMQAELDRVLDTAWQNRDPDLPLQSKAEALVLASLIEKETGQAAERKRIAGVFINRLRRGMLLQTDPTVIYALTQGKPQKDGQGPLGRRLLRKDLQIDSPYNTYLYAGLPPTPIANAGAASIQAALQPEAHEYLYFVADGTGGHAFSKTLAEHNRNVAKWRKVRP